MMHSSSCNDHLLGGGGCTCGSTAVFHHHHTQSNHHPALSMLFSMPANHDPFDHYEYSDDHIYPFTASPSSYSSVDCTLSLGTPSTRLTTNTTSTDRRRSSFSWDNILQKNKHASSPSKSHSNNNSSGGGGGGGGGGDPLLARRCANCDTTSTPLWRNGPRGPKSLCNACGIRFKKEERRATASGTNGGGSAGASGMMEPHQHMINNSWVHHSSSQSQKIPCYSPATSNEFRFIDNSSSSGESDSGIPFLSWRLNVADRPGLVHDFTRY
ncbi:hypothetical protein Vadar_001919 [Vaccinium darrowii]|uniref:Uncharacterized protein n=1 Tax=Vaccinium darrowii TaxID=229202 RepID=A0ACB7XXK3_9ERIC|nr:hypothetical protein Vadar_001919 [Vaccinium darrowii]